MSNSRVLSKPKVDYLGKFSITDHKDSVEFYNPKLAKISDHNFIGRGRKKITTNNTFFRLKNFSLILMLLINISQIILCNKLYPINSQYSYIELTIKEVGVKSILGANFPTENYPYEIIINGNNQDIARNYNFSSSNSIVQLIWNDTLIDCSFQLFLKLI